MRRAGAGAAGRTPKSHKLPERFPPGEVFCETLPKKRRWQLGDLLGQGGFGMIYKALDITDGPSTFTTDLPCVLKVEPLDNGPLFCEFHFYLHTMKPLTVAQWTKTNRLQYLGVPQYFGSGQHIKGDRQYRFLVLQHLGCSLQKMFEQNGHSFSEQTTFAVGLRMLDALEYIHSKGYCHADVKAANILLGYSNGRVDFNKVYLVDFGLSASFLQDTSHKPYKEDPRRAHDGTVEYASRDAHKGVPPSRRGDLEILGYCMLEWLAGRLPWDGLQKNKDRVRDLKIQYMSDIPGLFRHCFGTESCHENLRKFFGAVSKLGYSEAPNYHLLRQFLRSELTNEWSLGLVGGASSARKQRARQRTETPNQDICTSPSTPSKPVTKSPTRTPQRTAAAAASRIRSSASATAKSPVSSGAAKIPGAMKCVNSQRPNPAHAGTIAGAGARAERPARVTTRVTRSAAHQTSVRKRKYSMMADEEADMQLNEGEDEDLDDDSSDGEEERKMCSIL